MISQLRPLLRAIKRTIDKSIPTIKAKMVEYYEQWLERPYLVNPSWDPLILETVMGTAVEEEENGSMNSAQEDNDENRSGEEEDNNTNDIFLYQEV